MSDESRRQKRRRRIVQNPKNVRFEDLQHLLEDYGFALKRTKGSHHSFVGYVNDEKLTLVIPFRKPLGVVYVKKTLAILDEIEPLLEEDTAGESATSNDDEND